MDDYDEIVERTIDLSRQPGPHKLLHQKCAILLLEGQAAARGIYDRAGVFRYARSRGFTYPQIAVAYGISKQRVSQVIRRV